ncbi:N-formylglutamate deformylase [Asticcacaulis sp. BYS171W]|uniref:N-formylglutamate deformylase n=1 Tax=Asticcacaulis aquaticus TaxID=2984212 RepID=A0ABT5HTN2_9CAUL|nr:N-formylglutamate deformylase [Asticcacaulis aquaticus]MDC7683428.1 N-formylglutamate deformylase [Asticcacaulis aquaticus]
MSFNNQSTDIFTIHQGAGPLVVAAPHVGTYLPPEIAAQLNDVGRSVMETDFHVHRLYDFAPELGASTLFAIHSRYVVDLNRDPNSAPLYPGQFETGMCPLTDFDLRPIYAGDVPSEAEINRRRQHYWWPYHAKLEELLEAARERHGFALLIDAHSIRPSIPTLFEGALPDLSFGTDSGRTCPADVLDALQGWMAQTTAYSSVLDGRFKGGFTTRGHGRPEDRVYALQIEIVQSCYLDMSDPTTYGAERARPLSETLKPLVETLISAAKQAK